MKKTIKIITEQNASPLIIYTHINSAKLLKGSVDFEKVEGNDWFCQPEKYMNWVIEQLGASSIDEIVFLGFEKEGFEELWDINDLSRNYMVEKEFPNDSIENEIGKIDMALGHIEIGQLGIDSL